MPTPIPKPKEEGLYTVTCGVCGSEGFYTMQQINTRSKWCKPAKVKKEKEAKTKKPKANRALKAVRHRCGKNTLYRTV